MCRLAAYLGPPLPLARLLTDAPHPLEKQTWAPLEMLTGTVNADGVGAGWWIDDAPEGACTYRNTLPAWADPNLRPLGRSIHGRCFLAAVRGATLAGTTSLTDTQPFQAGRLLFMHNGFITDFATQVRRPLLASLSDVAHAAVPGISDSAHLFAIFQDEVRAAGDVDRLSAETLASVLDATLARATGLCHAAGSQGLINLVVSDGQTIVAARHATDGAPPSLHLAESAPSWDGGSVIASEPLDPGAHWRPVPPGHLVVLRADGRVTVRPLTCAASGGSAVRAGTDAS